MSDMNSNAKEKDSSFIKRYWWVVFIPGVGISAIYCAFYIYTRRKPPVYRKSVVEVDALLFLALIIIAIAAFIWVVLIMPDTQLADNPYVGYLSALVTGYSYGLAMVYLDKKLRKPDDNDKEKK